MYQLVVFIHVVSAFTFLLTHGVTIFTMVRLRTERNPANIQTLLDLRRASNPLFGISYLGLLLAGIAGGFMGNWWSQGWIGVSLLLFLALTVVMTFWGRQYLERVRQAIQPEPSKTGTPIPNAPATAAELDAILKGGHVPELMIIGFGGLLVILWLMLFKPF